MPYDVTLVRENDLSRERLRELFARLTDAQYAIAPENAWTIGSTLAHVAVFDRRAIEILNRWEREGVAPSPNDPDIINGALAPFLRELPPAAISRLAMEFAEILDAKLAALPDAVLDEFESKGGAPFRLSRASHRNEHVEQIEAVLGGNDE